MYQVDLNSDLGESYGAYTIGCDAEVIGKVTSANIACGWHAGDPLVLDKTIGMATVPRRLPSPPVSVRRS